MRTIFYVVLAVGLSLVFVDSAAAIKILMHGREAGATYRDDPFVFAHLEATYGAENVDYMQGALAAVDGSSAVGYDVLFLSSTMASSAIRGKYEDSTVGVVDGENAVIHNDAVGNFMMSDLGGNQDAGKDRHKINILNPGHPLAAGLSGEVTVFTTPPDLNWTQYGRGPLAPGVTLIADADNTDQPLGDPSAEHAIFAADVGAALLGDGSEGSPATAAGRRVFFFVSDFGFFDLTTDGVALFDAAITWAATDPVPVPADYNGNFTVDAADYVEWRKHSGSTYQLTNEVSGVTPGDVTAEDYTEWQARFGNRPSPGSGAGSGTGIGAVPEPASIGMLLVCLGYLAARRRR